MLCGDCKSVHMAGFGPGQDRLGSGGYD